MSTTGTARCHATCAVPIDTSPHAVESAQDRELATLAKAIAHPTRVQILRLLAAQQTCMYGSLAELLPLAKSTVSQHLNILKKSGLVRGTLSGPRTCYCVEPRSLDRLKALLGEIVVVTQSTPPAASGRSTP